MLTKNNRLSDRNKFVNKLAFFYILLQLPYFVVLVLYFFFPSSVARVFWVLWGFWLLHTWFSFFLLWREYRKKPKKSIKKNKIETS